MSVSVTRSIPLRKPDGDLQGIWTCRSTQKTPVLVDRRVGNVDERGEGETKDGSENDGALTWVEECFVLDASKRSPKQEFPPVQ